MKGRAYLWPALLIAVGLLALLVNLGAIPADRIYRLADLWPLLLIVLGLELLINRARLPSTVETTASVLVIAIALVGAGVYVATGPPISTATKTMSASAKVGELKDATLEVDAGSSELDIESSPTGLVDDLFQAQISYSGPTPTVSVDSNSGRVVIRQDSRFGYFGTRNFRLSVQLNVAVRWRIAIHTGASRDKYVLGLQLASMEIDTGASTEDITLPTPSGTVPVRINGGALTVHLHRPSASAASVKVSGGAVSLNFDGDQSSAVGSVSHSTAEAADMLDITVNGGACTVTMDTGSGLD